MRCLKCRRADEYVRLSGDCLECYARRVNAAADNWHANRGKEKQQCRDTTTSPTRCLLPGYGSR